MTDPQPVSPGVPDVPDASPADRRAAPRWGLPTAIGSLAGFAVASFAVSALLTVLGVDPVLAGVLGTFTGWLFLAGWPVLAARKRGNGVRSDLAWEFRRVDIGIGLLAAFAVFGAAVIFLLVYVQIAGELPSSALGETAANATASWQIIALAVLALGAPFVEEVHFRGMWWSALSRRGLGRWLTLIVTSCLFALVHLEPTRLPLLFVAGFAAGLVRLLTDRLGPAIVTHLAVNGLATLGLLSML